jgi:transcriptional regulator with XRE-family HTH domain
MTPSIKLVQALRATLKARGITYRKLAHDIGVSEPTVKRALGGRNFSLRRLDQICAALQIDFDELLRGAESKSELTQLSDRQEIALASNPRLLLITYLLINHWTPAEIHASFNLDRDQQTGILLQLDKLGIIDFRPPSRVKRLTGRNFMWRKDGPVHAFFISRVAPEFFDARFDNQGDEFRFVGGTLSPESRAQMQIAVRRLADQFDQLARADSRLSLDHRDGCAAVLAIRKWEFSEFTRLRRTK